MASRSNDDNEPLLGDETDGDDASPKLPKWDYFRDIPPKQDSGSQVTVSYIDYSVRLMKLLAYAITFLIVLAAGIVAKATMLLMTSQLKPKKTQACISEFEKPVFKPSDLEPVLWTWVLFIVFAIPELGTLFRATRKVFFKKSELPLLKVFGFYWLMESLHIIGKVILIFQVLPNLDAVRGVMLTNAVCIVPAILRWASRSNGDPYSLVKFILDGVAVVFQFSALIAWPIFENSGDLAYIAPALVLTSCGWWMNYLPKLKPVNKGIIQTLWQLREGLNEKTLYVTYFVMSIWKILLFFAVMLITMAIQGSDLQLFFDNTYAAFQVHNFTGVRTRAITPRTLVVFTIQEVHLNSSELGWLYIGIAQAVSAYICYAFSKFACRILIQKFSMALSSILVVPGTILTLIVMDQFQNGQSGDLCIFNDFIPSYMFWNMETSSTFITDKFAWIWILWIVSQVWITLHIWFPACERLANTEKIFTTPHYSTFLIDQSVALNRKVDDEPEISVFDDIPVDDENVPRVIACATMWHENKDEMLDMFKSVLRQDFDQCTRSVAKEQFKTAAAKSNYYEFETHIFFDDAFSVKENTSEYVINQFVRDMIDTLPVAVREVHRSNILKLKDPKVIPTPYGGRMVYQLPGRTMMYVHLKHRKKIRARKRWSQCMYMYYLLGYKLMNDPNLNEDQQSIRARNTYILALDGDIDFSPKAVLLLVDLMKKNDNLGAACGRIHPVGSGLMAWYQVFEYAIGHWLQKATEHVFGCVLCSPGCFSLFRGEALMDDNVMRTYTKECDAARHHVQYDQGEDRWLCTLLLQQGYRVEYSAASDAYTHCPEDFNEFYNQRRRWVPSTMANILDLLGSYKRTIEANSNISMPYIVYQLMLLGGTILGPGTIFLMLVGAFVAAFKIDNWSAFYYNLIPIIIFIVVCLFLSSKVQLMFALIISVFYGLVMMAVLVGILIQINEDGFLAPSTLFLFIVAGEIIVAGLFHPQEFNCLPSGAIYYVTIPSMYLLLIIYSVCNLNVISWGTREVAENKTPEEIERDKKEAEEAEENAKKKKENGEGGILSFIEYFAPGQGKKEKGSVDISFAGLFRCMLCTQPKDFDEEEQFKRIGESLLGVKDKLERIERHIDPLSTMMSRGGSRMSLAAMGNGPGLEPVDPANQKSEINKAAPEPEYRDPDFNPYWMDEVGSTIKGTVDILPTDEKTFWQQMIKKYLTPIDVKMKERIKIEDQLKELRDKTVLAFFMLNALFVTVIFLLQLNKDIIFINWPLGIKSNISYSPTDLEITVTQSFLQLEPIGFIFVIFFAIILLIQFTGMFLHRFQTMCHVLSTTEIFPTESSVSSIDEMVENLKKEVNVSGQKDEDDEDEENKGTKSDINLKRRTTIHKIALEAERKSSAPDLKSALTRALGGMVKEGEERENEKSSNRTSLFVRKSSAAPRNTRAVRKSVAFQSIAE